MKYSCDVAEASSLDLVFRWYSVSQFPEASFLLCAARTAWLVQDCPAFSTVSSMPQVSPFKLPSWWVSGIHFASDVDLLLSFKPQTNLDKCSGHSCQLCEEVEGSLKDVSLVVKPPSSFEQILNVKILIHGWVLLIPSVWRLSLIKSLKEWESSGWPC